MKNINKEAGPSRVETPGKKRQMENRVKNPDAFQEDSICHHKYEYYSRKEYPTIKKLHIILHEANFVTGNLSSLRLAIKKTEV